MKRSVDKSEGNDDDDDREITSSHVRLKAAKNYVNELYELHGDAEPKLQKELVKKKIRQDLLEKDGKFKFRVGDNVTSTKVLKTIRRHKAPVAACAFSRPDGRAIFTCCKEGLVVKSDIETGQKIAGPFKANSACISLALSSDSRLLAVGSRFGELFILDTDTLKPIKQFSAHRGIVSSMAFQPGTHRLYTGGADHLVKIWEPDHGGYIDVLCGHTDMVASMSCLTRERPLTAGSRDFSLRLWKIAEESQLVYKYPSADGTGFVDACAYVDDSDFVSGSTDGSLCLWGLSCRKPLATVQNAHGLGSSGWISSVAALPYSDLVASGAGDGQLRLWSANAAKKTLLPISTVPLPGCINSIDFLPITSSSQLDEGRILLAAAVGREHRLGRWAVSKNAKNSLVIVEVKL